MNFLSFLLTDHSAVLGHVDPMVNAMRSMRERRAMVVAMELPP